MGGARTCSLALTGVLAFAGCAATPTADPPPALAIGPIEPASRAVALADLVRPAGTVARHAIVEGDAERGEIVERFEEPAKDAAAADAAPDLVRTEERDGRIVERMEFRSDGEGRLLLVRVDSLADRSRSLFGAPLPFAADLAPGAELSASTPMTVLTLPGLRKRAEGSARRVLRVAGECDLAISGERMRAIALDLEFDVALDVARAEVRSRLFVVPGRGVVAEIRDESRTILRLIRTDSAETTVLRSIESADAPAEAPKP